MKAEEIDVFYSDVSKDSGVPKEVIEAIVTFASKTRDILVRCRHRLHLLGCTDTELRKDIDSWLQGVPEDVQGFAALYRDGGSDALQ